MRVPVESKRRAKLWGCGVSAVLFLAAVGFLLREVALRTTPVAPRQSSKPLPRTKPPGVERWDVEAAALLEQNERTLQTAQTLSVTFTRTYSDNFWPRRPEPVTLVYARPNRLRIEEPRHQSVSDGWLLWSLWAHHYYCGFTFPDGRGQNYAPFAGFFPKSGGWEALSYADLVRSALRGRTLKSLTVEHRPQGPRVTIDWGGQEQPESMFRGTTTTVLGHTTELDLDAQALPRRVVEYRTLWKEQRTEEWLPVTRVGFSSRQLSYDISSVTLNAPVAPETFVMKLPPDAKPTGDTARFEKLFQGFVTLRDWALPE